MKVIERSGNSAHTLRPGVVRGRTSIRSDARSGSRTMNSHWLAEAKLPSVTRKACSVPRWAVPPKVQVAGRDSSGSTLTRSMRYFIRRGTRYLPDRVAGADAGTPRQRNGGTVNSPMPTKMKTIHALLVLASGLPVRTATAQAAPPYRDATRPIDTRVQDLLARMTPAEKFWQLYMSPGNLDDPSHDYSHGSFGLQVDAPRDSGAAAD